MNGCKVKEMKTKKINLTGYMLFTLEMSEEEFFLGKLFIYKIA